MRKLSGGWEVRCYFGADEFDVHTVSSRERAEHIALVYAWDLTSSVLEN